MIWVIFEYVRHNFVSVTFLLNKIFVSQMAVEIFGIQKKIGNNIILQWND